MPRPNTPYDCHVHCVRKRLADVDGISAKAAIDGIVKAKLLSDDSAKVIKSFKVTQEKCDTTEQEKTVIRFYE
jgi:peroxiredoxin